MNKIIELRPHFKESKKRCAGLLWPAEDALAAAIPGVDERSLRGEILVTATAGVTPQTDL